MTPEESRALFNLISFMHEQRMRGRVAPSLWRDVEAVERMFEERRTMRLQLTSEIKDLAVRAQFEREG